MEPIDRRTRIGLIFTSQDRYPISRMALTSAIEGIDSTRFDVTVLWLDGSAMPEASDFFEHFAPDGVTLLKHGGYRNPGAARTIQLGMNLLKEVGEFDWIGMIESDCYFLQGWLDAAFRACDAARSDGVRVGALAVGGSQRQRWRHEYAKTEILCASNALFLPEAWELVPPAAITHNFPKSYFADLCTLPMLHPSAELGWDWIFSIALYHAGGFDVITTPRAYVLNCLVPDSHPHHIFEPLIAQQDFESPVLCELPSQAPRREAEWGHAVRMCHASSDAAILRCNDMRDFSHLSLEFLHSWYGKESNDQEWWRWADGTADLLVHNSSSRRLLCKLNFGLRTLVDDQVVTVRWNGEDIDAFRHNSRCCREVEIPPGISVLRFDPKLPGKIIRGDPRRLSFSLLVAREWFDEP